MGIRTYKIIQPLCGKFRKVLKENGFVAEETMGFFRNTFTVEVAQDSDTLYAIMRVEDRLIQWGIYISVALRPWLWYEFFRR